MSPRSWRHFFTSLAIALSPSTAVAQTASNDIGPEALPASRRPAFVPPHYVATPHGYFDPSCVVEVKEGEFVDAQDNVVGSSGVARPLSMCLFPHYRPDGEEASATFEPSPPWTGVSWVAAVNSVSTGSTSWISANWVVPNDPQVSSVDTTIYYFPGLVDQAAAPTFILQPVLGWNASYDYTWTIAGWNCCRNGNELHSALQTVSPGTSIYGYVWGTNCDAGSGVCSSWQVSASAAGGPQTTLNTDSYGQALTDTISGALEAYNLDSCLKYPPDDGITFSNVDVRNASGEAVPPSWQANLYAVSPTCERNATFTDGSATITWQHCAYPYTLCPGGCALLSDDEHNCGACGNACPYGMACVAGRCRCPYPLKNCHPGCFTQCR